MKERKFVKFFALTKGEAARKRLLSLLLVAVMLFANVQCVLANNESAPQIKNIIYMIPDGGGMASFYLADYVKQAGGFIVQLMPFAEDAVIDKLEQNLATIQSVTSILDGGNTPEQMLKILLAGLEPEITDTMPAQFYCNCDKERVEKALISIGKAELKDMIDEGKEIEVNCHFCNTNYAFSVEELKGLYRKSAR